MVQTIWFGKTLDAKQLWNAFLLIHPTTPAFSPDATDWLTYVHYALKEEDALETQSLKDKHEETENILSKASDDKIKHLETERGEELE